MADALRTPDRMTVEEFFEWQQLQPMNYELVDGLPIPTVKAMTGASDRHDAVTVNAVSALALRLRGKPCFPRTQDRSIRTWRGSRRPDVFVECGKPEPRSMAAAEPRVVIEILSPSTARFDRFQKLDEYQRQPLIRVILLVDTDQPRVIVWPRGEDGWSATEASGLDAVIFLPEIDAELPLADLFDRLEFPAPLI